MFIGTNRAKSGRTANARGTDIIGPGRRAKLHLFGQNPVRRLPLARGSWDLDVMSRERPRLTPFLFGVFGFAMATAAFGAILFIWPSLISGIFPSSSGVGST